MILGFRNQRLNFNIQLVILVPGAQKPSVRNIGIKEREEKLVFVCFLKICSAHVPGTVPRELYLEVNIVTVTLQMRKMRTAHHASP